MNASPSETPAEAPAQPVRMVQMLKAGLHRRVFVAEGPAGTRQLIKRFEGRGFLKRLGDGRRARREFEMLRELHARGVPVPHPGELRRREGAWEFTCEYLEHARSLEELLEARAQPVECAAPEELARALGRALAVAHGAGLDHGDLHPGNILFDRRGQVSFIDFGNARRRATPNHAQVLSDLVGLAGATRERCSLRLRQRALIAWRRSLRGAVVYEIAEHLGHLATLARRIEHEAVPLRARVVLEHSDRWSRESGRCRYSEPATLVSRHMSEGDAVVIEDLLGAAVPNPEAPPHPSDEGLEVVLFVGGTALREDWIELGRALEHALPALRPLAIRTESRMRAAFSAPRGSAAVPTGAHAGLDDLNRELRDRGIRELADASHLWRSPEGSLLLGPGVRLQPMTEVQARHG